MSLRESEGAEFAAGSVVSARHEPSVASVADYLALMKPRVMSLVVFTALVGLVIAPRHMHPVIAFTALLCIAVGAGAAGALNMWYDADIDAVMTRTSNRPIPQRRIAPGEALAFGIVLAAFSVATLGLLVSWFAAGLLAFTVFFYLVIFFWTPPHFWALSLTRTDDYARAGIPMLPVVAGAQETRRQILLYSVTLVPIGAAPWLFGYADAVYGVAALIAGLLMVEFAWRVRNEREGARAARAAHHLFAFSSRYLFVLFAVLLV